MHTPSQAVELFEAPTARHLGRELLLGFADIPVAKLRSKNSKGVEVYELKNKQGKTCGEVSLDITLGPMKERAASEDEEEAQVGCWEPAGCTLLRTACYYACGLLATTPAN